MVGIRRTAPLLRTYSLSGAPDAESYRISVKREPHGAASSYRHDRLRTGDVIEAAQSRVARWCCNRDLAPWC